MKTPFSRGSACTKDAADRGSGLPAPGMVRLAERLLFLRRPHLALGVVRVQISSWPWESWPKACRCPGTTESPGDSSSGSLLSGQPSSPSSLQPAPSSSSSPGCPPSSRRPSPTPRVGSSTWCLGWWRFLPVYSAGFSLIISSIRVTEPSQCGSSCRAWALASQASLLCAWATPPASVSLWCLHQPPSASRPSTTVAFPLTSRTWPRPVPAFCLVWPTQLGPWQVSWVCVWAAT
ncbi:voltage-gated purine nucleotide uniporter SLC17A9 isoform X9 [Macaca fascicularis]|uniref:voltage-gated purine nucleotide uniporter SLC17A9 isoform X9 n=1 Tax=Macaca fascicularis TaxID=9541 RepID=UPI003D15E215